MHALLDACIAVVGRAAAHVSGKADMANSGELDAHGHALCLGHARDELVLFAGELQALGAQVGLQVVHAQRAQPAVRGQVLQTRGRRLNLLPSSRSPHTRPQTACGCYVAVHSSIAPPVRGRSAARPAQP